MGDRLLCPICFKRYNDGAFRPMDICREGHTFCETCLQYIQRSANPKCSTCKNQLEPRVNRALLHIVTNTNDLNNPAQGSQVALDELTSTNIKIQSNHRRPERLPPLPQPTNPVLARPAPPINPDQTLVEVPVHTTCCKKFLFVLLIILITTYSCAT